MGRTESRQEEINIETADLTRDLNRVIRNTIPYRLGNFRFIVREGSDGIYNIMIADISWRTKFEDKFKRIALKHGWILIHKKSGIYNLYPANGKDYTQIKTIIEGGKENEPLSERTGTEGKEKST